MAPVSFIQRRILINLNNLSENVLLLMTHNQLTEVSEEDKKTN